MKLGADDSVLADDRGQRPAVIGARQHVSLIGRIEVIGVNEITMAALRAQRQTLQHRMLPDHVERIPAHVRNFQILFARRNLHDVAGDPVEPGRRDMFLATRCHQLHADADAEERPRLVAHRFRHRLDHAVKRVEAPAAIGEGADAGQHDAVSAIGHFRIAGHHDLFRIFQASRGTLECLRSRVQIAGTVIDDGNAHRDAPGSGNDPMISLCGNGGGRENG